MGLNSAIAVTANEMDKSGNEMDRSGALDMILESEGVLLYKYCNKTAGLLLNPF